MPNSIKEDEYNLERFFSISPDILCIVGYDGYFKKINPALPSLLGYTKEELMQIPIIEFVHKDDKQLTTSARDNLKRKIPLFNFENRYVSKSGESIWLSWTSISEEENQIIYAVAKDITHVKKLEEERNLLLLNLTRLNADLKKFTYMVSHDLRSPVSNVISLFSLLDLTKIKDPETLEYIEFLNEANLEMDHTLNRYVDAISTDKKINAEVKFLNLNDNLNSVKHSINELIKISKVTFEVDFSKVTHLRFNEYYLQSIFLNLISNSLKFLEPNRELVIKISSHKCGEEPQLIFSDNGIGFDMNSVGDDIFKIHQKFSDNSESKGIGLYFGSKSHGKFRW